MCACMKSICAISCAFVDAAAYSVFLYIDECLDPCGQWSGSTNGRDSKQDFASMKLTIALLSVLACTAAGLGQYSKLYRPEEDIAAPEGCCGKALNLSPFLSAGDVKGARDAAKVIGVGNYTSYAGFFNVDQTVDNNMYWWYVALKASACAV